MAKIGVHPENDLRLGDASRLHSLRHRRAGQRHRADQRSHSQQLRHHPLLSWLRSARPGGRQASAYIASIVSLYFMFTNVRFSFIVGVSSSSSAVKICSMRENFLIVSTRASCRFTRSISPQIRSCTSLARQSEAKLVNGTLRS